MNISKTNSKLSLTKNNIIISFVHVKFLPLNEFKWILIGYLSFQKMKTHFAHFMQNTSVESGSCGCRHVDWQHQIAHDPCPYTTKTRHKILNVWTFHDIGPGIILKIFKVAHHCLKVHLLLHQSFRDLCCLLEMDIV